LLLVRSRWSSFLSRGIGTQSDPQATRRPFPAKTHLPAGADTLFGHGDDAAQLGTRLLGQVSYSENPRCPCRALSFLSRQKPSVDSSTRTRVNELRD